LVDQRDVAVIYARVSTKDQDVRNQILVLARLCEESGLEVRGIHTDPGVSGYETKPMDRPGFRAAFNSCMDLRKQGYRVYLAVFSLDRIARRYDYLIETLDMLQKHEVMVVSYQEQFLREVLRIPDPLLRRFVYDIIIRALAYAYQMYVESLREKIRAGMERARAEGRRIGRPPKVDDETLQSYFKYYVEHLGFSIKDMWRVLREHGYDISYDAVLKRLKKLGLT